MMEVLNMIVQLSVLVFVISSMVNMGLTLKLKQITSSLKDAKLVILALVINFILSPLIAYLISQLFSLDQPLQIGLILLATASGSPFLPKLVEIAKGNAAFSVGIMVLLMVITIVYMPLVLPLLLPGIEVNPWDIAQSLILLMLLPLVIALLINARYEEIAAKLQPVFSQASSTAMLFMLVAGVIVIFSRVISLIGTFGIIAAVIFVVAIAAIGYFLGGSDIKNRRVMGLGSAQRNISAALVVAAQNFNADVVTYVMVLSLITFLVLMPVAGEMGKRQIK